MKAIARQLELQYPADNRGQGAVVPLSEVLVPDVRPILLALLGGAGLLAASDCLCECVELAAGSFRKPQA